MKYHLTRSPLRYAVLLVLATLGGTLPVLAGEQWSRQKDFQPGTRPGETNVLSKNWSYFWNDISASKDYEKLTPMVWDESWWDSGLQVWAKANNVPPSVVDKAVSLDLNSLSQNFAVVVSWKNTSGSAVRAKVEGSLTPTWALGPGGEEPKDWPNVQFQILKADASGKTEKASFEKELKYKKDHKKALELNESLEIPPDGSIYFTYSITGKEVAKGFVMFNDLITVSAK